jgi:hypothetical protein
MIRRVLLAAAALVLPLLALTPALAAGSRLGCVDDPRLSEVSGIAALRRPSVCLCPERPWPLGSVLRGGHPHRPHRRCALWLSGEGLDQPILTVALPRAVLLAPPTTASHSSSGSPSSSPAPGNGSSDSAFRLGLIAIVAAAVMAFILGSRLRRRRRHKDQGGEDLPWTG